MSKIPNHQPQPILNVAAIAGLMTAAVRSLRVHAYNISNRGLDGAMSPDDLALLNETHSMIERLRRIAVEIDDLDR